jgi:aspartate/methionine/tyrosine aminotransferase
VLARRPGWSDSERAQLGSKRARMHAAATQIGLIAGPPEGGCYVFARLPDGSPSAADFARQLVVQQRITAAPGSLFFADPVDGERYLRFAYNKSDEILDAALDRLVAA